MSADKRKTILIGFAGLAVVLVAIIAVVSPKFKSEDATGAIGAVQKHRAPQIAKQDVVLGNEQQKQEQKIIFADYASDAAALKGFATALNAKDQQAESRIILQTQNLNARLQNDFTEALAMAKKFADSENLESRRKARAIAEVEAIGVKAQSRLSSEEMEALAVRLNAVCDELGVKQAARIQSMNVDAANLEALNAYLKSVEQAELAIILQSRADYALEMAKQMKVLSNEGSDEQMASRLMAEAEQLQARAQQNLTSFVANESAEIAELGRMAEMFSKMQATSQAANEAELVGMKRRFAAHAAEAEANLNAMVAERSLAAMLSNFDESAVQARKLGDEAESLAHRFAK
jgi:hypothetical protein